MTAAIAVLALTQVVAVSIDVRPDETGTVVTANYRLRSPNDSVVFHAMRYSIAPIDFILGSYPVDLEESSGTYRFALPVLDRRIIVRYVYHVAGDGTRIPIFVPDQPTDPDSTRGIRIRVIGYGDNVRLADGFPRWSRQPDGSILATPANVPSFLHLPRRDGPIPASRVADVVVIALIAAGSGWWLATRLRARGPRQGTT